MQSLHHKDPVLAKRLAYCMMLINRENILDYGNKFEKTERNQIGPDFVEMLTKKMYTLPEIKAIRDLKFLEACILVLINSEKIDLKKKYTTQEYVEIIVSKWTNYLEQKLSDPPSQNENPPDYFRIEKIDFPADVCQNNKFIPKFLARKVDEFYSEYLERITKYLKNLEKEQLNEILGELDPTDKRQSAAMTFLEKVIEDKNSCVIF